MLQKAANLISNVTWLVQPLNITVRPYDASAPMVSVLPPSPPPMTGKEVAITYRMNK